MDSASAGEISRHCNPAVTFGHGLPAIGMTPRGHLPAFVNNHCAGTHRRHGRSGVVPCRSTFAWTPEPPGVMDEQHRPAVFMGDARVRSFAGYRRHGPAPTAWPSTLWRRATLCDSSSPAGRNDFVLHEPLQHPPVGRRQGWLDEWRVQIAGMEEKEGEARGSPAGCIRTPLDASRRGDF